MFQHTVWAVIYVTIILWVNRAEGATTQDSNPDQILERFLSSLTKQSTQNTNNQPKDDNRYIYTEPTPIRQPPVVHQEPVAGPIALEAPVAWPYPPAPKSSGGSEFPLLERFLSSNGITNYRNTYPSNPNPAPIQPPNQWKPIIPSTQSPIGLPPPPPQPRPTPVMIPPPLQVADNWGIDHNTRNGDQRRHYNLDTVRLSDGQTPNIDKLNVSFIMAPHVRPLSLNFDSGEIVVDFGGNSGKIEKVANYKSKIPDFDQIYRTQSDPNKDKTQENDEEYIVLRHDVNKYAYDMNKDGNNGGSGGNTGAAQPMNVERYSIPGNKDTHFVLGRVSH